MLKTSGVPKKALELARVMEATANFGFLQGHDLRFVTLGAQAERYFRDDPSTAIVKLRQYSELLAKLVAAHHALYLRERETFGATLRRLSFERIPTTTGCVVL
jgi:type I restriction enzyme R subunit